MDWKLTEAKNKFSELVNRALSEGPQRVSRRDEAVIVLSQNEYDKLTGKRSSFKEFLMKAPDFEGLDLTRDKSSMRAADL